MVSWLDLDSDEELLYLEHPSVWQLVPSIIVGAVGSIAGIIFILFPELISVGILELVELDTFLIGTVLLVLSPIVPIGREIRRRAVVYAVTDEQIVYKTGILSENTDPIPHSRIVDFRVRQSPIDRVLKKGDIDISTAGSDGNDVLFADAPHTPKVKQQLNSHVKRGKQQHETGYSGTVA